MIYVFCTLNGVASYIHIKKNGNTPAVWMYITYANVSTNKYLLRHEKPMDLSAKILPIVWSTNMYDDWTYCVNSNVTIIAQTTIKNYSFSAESYRLFHGAFSTSHAKIAAARVNRDDVRKLSSRLRVAILSIEGK